SSEYGIEFHLGFAMSVPGYQQTIQDGSIRGLTERNLEAYAYTALKQLIFICPEIQGFYLKRDGECDDETSLENTPFFDSLFQVISEYGNRMKLRVNGMGFSNKRIQEILNERIKFELSYPFSTGTVSLPYQPRATASAVCADLSR